MKSGAGMGLLASDDHWVGELREGLAVAFQHPEGYFHVMADGTRAYQKSFDWVGDFQGGTAPARKNGNEFRIHMDGKKVRPEGHHPKARTA